MKTHGHSIRPGDIVLDTRSGDWRLITAFEPRRTSGGHRVALSGRFQMLLVDYVLYEVSPAEAQPVMLTPAELADLDCSPARKACPLFQSRLGGDKLCAVCGCSLTAHLESLLDRAKERAAANLTPAEHRALQQAEALARAERAGDAA